MKTNWQDIKDRVELKIGEDIPMKEFAILANESISDLQEIALVKAPTKYYELKDIMREDEEYDIEVDLNNFTSDIRQGFKEFQIDLPFSYHPGYGEIDIFPDVQSNPQILFREENYILNNITGQKEENWTSGDSNRLYAKFGVSVNELKNPDGTYKTLGYKVVRKTLSLEDKQSSLNEIVIKKPDNFFRTISLKIVDNENLNTDIEQTSSSSPNDVDYRYGTHGSSAYYVDNELIHIFTDIEKIKRIKLSYFKQMDRVNKQVDIDKQVVQLEPGFENILTLSICHKWLENFVGTEDEETQIMFKKYLTLKQEYEATAKERKEKRRQTRIISAY